MSRVADCCHWRGETLLLDLHVQPRASRDRIVGEHGERIKVTITAPPVDGRANTHLRRFLAKAFGVPPSRVEVVAGQSGRDKRIAIEAPGKTPDALAALIPRHPANQP